MQIVELADNRELFSKGRHTLKAENVEELEAKFYEWGSDKIIHDSVIYFDEEGQLVQEIWFSTQER